MKMTFLKTSLLIFTFFSLTAGYGQMIKAPTNPKPATEPARKPVSKPVVKFKDDDDKLDSAAAPKKDNTFAYLVIKSNRGSAINVNINDNESGKIKAGMSKRIPITNGDGLRIALNDGQGNLYDTTFVVEDKDAGKSITVVFPEVDYGAIRTEEARLKKERDDQLKLLRDEEARKLKEAEDEAIRKMKEEAEALRLLRVGLLTETENSLRELIKQSLSEKASLQQSIDQIKKGELSITPEVVKVQENFLADKSLLTTNLKIYNDSSIAYNMKDKKDNFLKEIKADHDKIILDSSHAFITAVQAGKRPMSASVQVAFKASRSSDIPFFLPKDSLEDGSISGKRPLLYALEVKSDTSVFKYLFANEVAVNNYGTRFPENKEIYATPLAFACMGGNLEIIKLFLVQKAEFFPSALTKLERKKQVKFLLTKFGDKADVLALLKEYKYNMDDGTEAINAAIASIDSSLVLVEGGKFTMGCNSLHSNDCASDEKPFIDVTVDSFYIAKFEVTQKIWSGIMDDENPSFFQNAPNNPVEMVSWQQITQFITRLNKFTGKTFRLPTEAEWEYAARGGKSENREFAYAGGNDINEVAWHKDNSNKTSPVGSKKANALGLHDMSGSVAEWCNDFYAADYFSRSTLINPKGPEVSAEKVVRGGSFMQSSWSSRLSNREGHEESFTNNNTGFRLAMSIKK